MKQVRGIITGGAFAMAGEQSGLSTCICKKVGDERGDAVKHHCIIRQQVLCAKRLPFAHVIKPRQLISSGLKLYANFMQFYVKNETLSSSCMAFKLNKEM